ncbi:MAG: SH3 domain-containing protein, partial [Anaerolineae bacterium]
LTVTPAISPTFTPALSPINTPTAKRTSAPKATAPPEKPKPTSPSPPPTSARVPTVVTATVISDLPLNLRAGPGTDYAKIGRLEKGTSLEVLARNERGDWLQVRLERGREGWVAAEYVQIAAEISSLPVAAGPPTPTLTPVSASEGTPTPTLSSLLREVEVVTPTATPTSKPLPDPSMMPPELKGKITFLSDREVRAGAPYVMDPDGTNVMRLTERWVYDLACELDTFSPDRSQRLFVYDGKVDERGKVDHQIWVQNLADGWIWPLVNNSGVNIKSFYVPGWDFDPAWSPDSRHIAYVSLTDGNEEIHVVDKDDTARPDRRLTANTWESDRHPSYSPDGSQIVFWSNRDVGRKQIWIMNADGSEQRCLLCNNPYNDWDPVWIKW